jgi:uncharacterized protein (DUF2141 family)
MTQMKKVIIEFCFLIVSSVTLAQQAGSLKIEATNFSSDAGKATINLFRQEDDIPQKPHLQVSAKIKDGKALIVFEGLPYGDYAAILYHDKNDNGTLDHRLGFPNEPMAFSNNWKLTLFSGMPAFEKLKFTFKEGSNAIYGISIK